ncbi:MAG TPA: hypothetical protein VKE98_00580, partial [Gemmataceae bacterium]|nr:hypothetical protein [Gemmataceae bacterium]
MRFLALCLSGWMVGVCGCGPHAQQFLSGFGCCQDGLAQKSARSPGSIAQVAHCNKDHASALPLASDEAMAPLRKLVGLKVTPEPSFAGPYGALTAAQCQCRAAQASGMGNLLEKEANLAPSHGHKGDMRQSLLSNSALEARNKDSAAALDLFYRLAEAEARWALLAASIDQVQKANAHGDKLKKQGLPLPANIDEFAKQDFDLKSDRVRLAVGIEKLNRNLARKIDIEGVPEEERLWPVADFSVPEEPIDVAAAVELGLAQRPELVFLRQASQDASPANVAELRKALSASNALLGSTGGPCMKLITMLCKDETGNRRQQIQQLQEQREREIADDIRQAAADMNGQVRLVVLANARSDYAGTKLKEQEDKLSKGTGSVFEVASARLTWLKARDQLVREVMAWHLAHTKLQEAQGLLAHGCDPQADLLTSCPAQLSHPQ